VKPYENTTVMELFPSGDRVRMVVTLQPTHDEESRKRQPGPDRRPSDESARPATHRLLWFESLSEGVRMQDRRGSKAKPVSLVLLLLLAALACDGASSGEATPGMMGAFAHAGKPKRDVRLTGLITLDEYDWFAVKRHRGVVQIDLATGTMHRFLEGMNPWRHPSGTTVFRQSCGKWVSRLALADRRGLIRVISPCSNEIKNPGASPSDFSFSQLSPDEKLVAAEVNYLGPGRDQGYMSATVIFEVATKKLVARFEGYYAPTWTPAGRLLVAGEGFYLADPQLTRLERIDRGQLNGPVNNPDVHPSGKRIVFEYNQQLWEMNLDGSGLRERPLPGGVLRYPRYSPDGRWIVFLATSHQDHFDRFLYFTDLATGKSFQENLNGILANHSSVVPNGPLSWTAGGR
jgi:hypothetical protein